MRSLRRCRPRHERPSWRHANRERGARDGRSGSFPRRLDPRLAAAFGARDHRRPANEREPVRTTRQSGAIFETVRRQVRGGLGTGRGGLLTDKEEELEDRDDVGDSLAGRPVLVTVSDVLCAIRSSRRGSQGRCDTRISRRLSAHADGCPGRDPRWTRGAAARRRGARKLAASGRGTP